ncbi:COMM domain-containing protein 2 [Tieghemostelium lacteum]|uniref:COMM domain-containing protein 2 n=1 Tax=Tieghemostelium lacteum TaxID=361077 RepID=A0A152A863_TIELA|nr:COMM domain-containing protein 2 [Tieghemostelium lacteum]|eukprot:KYR02331.1 COMM domain-containing protein 2 [Tieghemostelium lacteum]
MIIDLDISHKQDLVFLRSQPLEVVNEFCKIALEFIKKGSNKKLYIAASQKLQVSPDKIESVINAISYLFTECSRFMLNENDFNDSISSLKYEDELTESLRNYYLEYRKDIRNVLQEFYPQFDHYSNLEWRLDVQIANRSLSDTVNPIYLLKLLTKNGGSSALKEQILQTDPNNLKHLCNELESALLEIRSYENRIIMRNIK